MSIKRFLWPAIGVLLVAGVAIGVQLRSRGSSSVAAAAPVSTEQRAVLHQAEERLIRRCMERAGFRYDEQDLPAAPVERRFPFVIDDIAWAKANGWAKPAAKPRGAMTDYFAKLPRDRQQLWSKTLVGQGKQLSVELPDGPRLSASDQGCIAGARRELYGDLPRWFTARKTADKLVYAVYRKVRADQRFAGAMKHWSACVRGHGYPSENPSELRGTVRDRADGKSAAVARGIERAAAVAEATCATTTGVGRTLRALEAEHLATITAEHRRELQDLAVLERDALPRATAVLRTA